MKTAKRKSTAANLLSWRVIIIRSRGEYLGSVEVPDRERAGAVAVKQFDLDQDQHRRRLIQERFRWGREESPARGKVRQMSNDDDFFAAAKRYQQNRILQGGPPIDHERLRAAASTRSTRRRVRAALEQVECGVSVHRLRKHPSLASVRRPHVQDEGNGTREVHHFGVAVFARLDPIRPIHRQRDIRVI
jgi:hypothetical protein